MKKLSVLLVLFVALFSQAKKFQVCSVTLNSDNEIQVFKKHLPSSHFSFIELAPQNHSVEDDEMQWFNKSCQNKEVKCDILVISGHFADMFFGTENKHILSIYELEKMACQGQCPRIFSQLREVFLFGCNTMAGKEKLYRTPDEYLKILVEEHDMYPTVAEMIVASRYSDFDPTFKARMEHIFEPQTRIYGFREISPYGHQSENALDKYFTSMKSQYGSYTQYLKSHYRNPQPNPHFSSAFDVLSATQQSFGMSSFHPQHSAYQQLCSLYSREINGSEKIKTVQKLFNQDKEFFAFSAIKNFLIHNKDSLSSSSQELFNKIQKENSNSREKFIQIYKNLSSNLVYMKSQILHFLHLMSWMNQDQYRKELTNNLLPLVLQSSTRSYDTLNTLVYENKLDTSDILIGYNDLGKNYLKDIWNVLIVDILKINNKEMGKDLMDYCKAHQDQNIVSCYQVLKTLGNIQTTDPHILDQMSGFLESEDVGLIYYAIYGLTYANATDAKILFKIYQNLDHENYWVRLQSLQSLHALGIIEASEKVQDKLENMLRTETNERIISELNRIIREVNSILNF